VFQITDMEGPEGCFAHLARVTLSASNGRLWRATVESGHYVVASSSKAHEREVFTLHRLKDGTWLEANLSFQLRDDAGAGKVAFQASDGRFVQAHIDPMIWQMPKVRQCWIRSN
jgi:hypothetical protein